ncbi:MAG: PA14 domain-containing protein [Phycisphaerae bacterium]
MDKKSFGRRIAVATTLALAGWAVAGQPDRAPGLRGEYFRKDNFADRLADRLDATVQIEDEQQLIFPAEAEAQSIRWTGSLEVPKSGRYTFGYRVDDELAVWIDGRKIIDQNESMDEAKQVEVELEAASKPIRIEYRNSGGGNAELDLHWKGPGLKDQPLGSTHLSVAAWKHMPPETAEAFDLGKDWKDSRTTGLRGQYFRGEHWDKRVHEQLDRSPDIPGNYPMPSGRLEEISVRWTGLLQVERDGQYTFEVDSDNGFWMSLNGRQVIAQSRHGRRSYKLKLEKGLYPLRIDHNQGGGDCHLRLRWSGPGFKDESLAGSVWTRRWKGMSPAEPMVVFLMYGHSNMDGRAKQTQVDHPRIWQWGDGVWQRLEEDKSASGPMLHALAGKYPNTHFGMVKVTTSGGTLKEDFLPKRWSYRRLIEEVGQIAGPHRIGGVVTMIGWCEGGQEEGEPRSFGEDFAKMIDSLRKDLDQPDLPFVVSQVEAGNPPKRDQAAWKTVHAAIADLPRYRDNVVVVPANDALLDTHHYDRKGNQIWAKRAAELAGKAKLVEHSLGEGQLRIGRAEAPKTRGSGKTLAVVRAKLEKISKARSVEQLGTYRHSLLTAQYRVMEVVSGEMDHKRILVLTYGIRDREPQKAARLRPGRTMVLELSDWADHRPLHSLAIDDDIDNYDSPQFWAEDIRQGP